MFPKKFAGAQYVSYDLKKANLTDEIATATFVVGFKTTEENSALASLEGYHDRHFSLVLANGYLTLFYSMKKKQRNSVGSLTDSETQILQISTRKLNNDEHNVARVIISTDEIFLTVPNYGLTVGANVTERFRDEMNKNLGKEIDRFGAATIFSVGRIETVGIDPRNFILVNSFTGCMTGAKLVFTNVPNRINYFPKPVEIDLFKLIQIKTSPNELELNPSGVFPAEGLNCGPSLSTPGKLNFFICFINLLWNF